MIRTLTPVYAATSSGVAAAFPCNLVNLQGYYAGGADAWLQIHDVSAVPANGVVPLKSFQLPAQLAYSWKFDPNELLLQNGLYVCISTTEGTKTLSASTADFLIDIEEYEVQMTNAPTVTGDLVTDVSYVDVWLRTDVPPPHRLLKVIAKNNTAGDLFLQIYGINYADLSASTKSKDSVLIKAGVTSTFYYGNVDGKIIVDQRQIVAGTLINYYGCTIAWSTVAPSFVDPGSDSGPIKTWHRSI